MLRLSLPAARAVLKPRWPKCAALGTSDAKYCSESAQSMDEYKLIARCRVGAAYGQTISVSSAAAFGPSTANTMDVPHISR